jgi:hypothetical protein
MSLNLKSVSPPPQYSETHTMIMAVYFKKKKLPCTSYTEETKAALLINNLV